MTFETFEKKLNKFYKKQVALIEEYENTMGVTVESLAYDLYRVYDELANVNGSADTISILARAFRESLDTNTHVIDCLRELVNRAVNEERRGNSLQIYFNDISRVYSRNNNNYNIEYKPENRDKLIEMNLKTVISVAKGYQGMGLDLDELICAGNMGLIRAFDKYDPNRAKLKDDMINAVISLPDDTPSETLLQTLQKFLTYGGIIHKFEDEFLDLTEEQKKERRKHTRKNKKVGKKKADVDIEDLMDDIRTEEGIEVQEPQPKIEPLPEGVTWRNFTKAEVLKWIRKNVSNASFNSVAFMWIRAFIMIELDNVSRLVKKPKTEIYEDKKQTGSYKREITIDIDAPIGDDNNTCVGDLLSDVDDSPNELDMSDAMDTFKAGLNRLLDGVKPRDRAVFLKKFGIGLPRPMLPKEIAIQEGLSIARISQIFQSVLLQMRKNQVKYNIDPKILFDAASRISA